MSIAVKILGGMDLAASFAFLMLIFGMNVPLQYTLFCAGLLLMKGMFILTGDVLSGFDIIASICLLISIIFALPTVILWTGAFLLLAKGLVSFI
ncbi:MAG: hypothetical protein Q7R87_04830 [Nanoarchaeota archaeon]|nr:hypothetical protein [Nanoarchaeota archaeon]